MLPQKYSECQSSPNPPCPIAFPPPKKNGKDPSSLRLLTPCNLAFLVLVLQHYLPQWKWMATSSISGSNLFSNMSGLKASWESFIEHWVNRFEFSRASANWERALNTSKSDERLKSDFAGKEPWGKNANHNHRFIHSKTGERSFHSQELMERSVRNVRGI